MTEQATEIKVGDRVGIISSSGLTMRGRVARVCSVAKITPKRIVVDGRQFDRNTWREVGGYGGSLTINPALIAEFEMREAERLERDREYEEQRRQMESTPEYQAASTLLRFVGSGLYTAQEISEMFTIESMLEAARILEQGKRTPE